MSDVVPHFWVPPTHLPDDLPAHEVWVREMPLTLAGAPSPHPPQTAPGYERARRLGLLPTPISDEPPVPLPGMNSVQALLALPALALLLLALLSAVDLGAYIPVPVIAVSAVMYRLFTYLRARDDAEEAAGYTHFAGARGLWRLSPLTGQPTRHPDPAVLPPGFYPSPYFPGLLQRWGGPGWAFLEHGWNEPGTVEHYVRVPAVDFLA